MPSPNTTTTIATLPSHVLSPTSLNTLPAMELDTAAPASSSSATTTTTTTTVTTTVTSSSKLKRKSPTAASTSAAKKPKASPSLPPPTKKRTKTLSILPSSPSKPPAPTPSAAKKRALAADSPGSRKHCHSCHQARAEFLACTLIKGGKRCGKVYCTGCLQRLYGISAAEEKMKVKDLSSLGHAQDEYVFRCLACRGTCVCKKHREEREAKERDGKDGKATKDGLEAFAKEAGVSTAEMAGIINDSATRTKGKQAKEKEAKPKEKVEKPPAVPRKKKVMEKKGPAADPTAAPTNKPTLETKSMATLNLPVVTGPLLPVIKKPKHVEDPNMQYITISYSLLVIEARLRVREFVLRFEKRIGLLAKYGRIINDPNSEWTDLTYKNLIGRLLSLIQSDDTPPLPTDLTYEAYRAVQSTSADEPAIWDITVKLLSEVLEIGPMPDIYTNEGFKLDVIGWLMEMAMATKALRFELDSGSHNLKDRHAKITDEIKKLRAEWEEQRQNLQKERLTVPAAGKADFEARFTSSHKASKKLILQAEEREWFQGRKDQPRYKPLGSDTLGNIYHLYSVRDKKEEDWGHWVVVEKNSALPHPTGSIPPPPAMPTDTDDPDAPEVPLPDDPEVVKARVWYCIEGAEDLRGLADWIKYKGETELYNQELAKQQTPPATTATTAISPTDKTIPGRHILEAVQVPLVKSSKQDLVVKEDFMPLVEKIKKISGFMELAQGE